MPDLRSTEFITACKSQSVNIHRLMLNSEHHSRRTRRAPLSFITSHKVRERESVHYFTVTPSKLSNNVHVKFRPGSLDVIFLNKDCTGVSVLFKTSTCSICHFMCFLVLLILFMQLLASCTYAYPCLKFYCMFYLILFNN